MINEFLSLIGKYGISKSSLFRLDITNPSSCMTRKSGVNNFLRDLSFFAESIEIPGTQILTQDYRIYDMTEKIAYGKLHDEINVIFRMDRDYTVKKFFDSWVDCIYNKKTGDVSYKNTYSGIIQIYQIKEDGASSYAIELIDCFPIQLGTISLGWENASELVKLPVTFSFKKMKIIPNKQIYRSMTNQSGGNILSNILNERNLGDVINLLEGKTLQENFDSFRNSIQTNLLDDNRIGLGQLRQIDLKNNFNLRNMFNIPSWI